MISNELRFDWEVSYALVTNELITQIQPDKKLCSHPDFRKFYQPYKYNVFSKTKLYETFANINIDDLSIIDDFVNQYGLLGLYIENKTAIQNYEISEYKNIIKRALDENSIDILKQYYEIKSNYETVTKFIRAEKTLDFINEVKIMRGLLELNSYKHIKVIDISKTERKLAEIAELVFEEDTINIEINSSENFEGASNLKLLEHSIKGFISAAINKKMKDVNRCLGLQYDAKNKTFNYVEAWEPKSLLGCMYAMLYTDLSQGKKTEICPYCLLPFVIDDDRGKEYHRGCRTNINTKRSRARKSKAIQLYHKGVSLDEVYKILNDESEKEIKIEQIKKWIGIKEG